MIRVVLWTDLPRRQHLENRGGSALYPSGRFRDLFSAGGERGRPSRVSRWRALANGLRCESYDWRQF
jgi:hypothetical protein